MNFFFSSAKVLNIEFYLKSLFVFAVKILFLKELFFNHFNILILKIKKHYFNLFLNNKIKKTLKIHVVSRVKRHGHFQSTFFFFFSKSNNG
jgi:hypothetical protein